MAKIALRLVSLLLVEAALADYAPRWRKETPLNNHGNVAST